MDGPGIRWTAKRLNRPIVVMMPLFQKLPELVLLDGLCLPSPATLWSSTKVAIGTINCNPHLDGTHCILPFMAQRGNQVRRDTTAVASSHDAFGACPSRIPPNTGSDHCSMWCTDNADSGMACRVVEARYTKRNLALGGRSLSLLAVLKTFAPDSVWRRKHEL